MLGFCQNWIFGQKIDFSNCVWMYEWIYVHFWRENSNILNDFVLAGKFKWDIFGDFCTLWRAVEEDWQVPCLEKFQFLATSIFLSIEERDQAFDTSKLGLKGGVRYTTPGVGERTDKWASARIYVTRKSSETQRYDLTSSSKQPLH